MDTQKITSPKSNQSIKSPTSPTIPKSSGRHNLNENNNSEPEAQNPKQSSPKKSSTENILSFLNDEKPNPPQDQILVSSHKESSEKEHSLEREEDSPAMSQTKKSILKRSSLKEIDMSPTLKKKGVAFDINPNEEIAPKEEHEEKLDDLFSMIRGRSKSNDADRNYGSFASGQGNNETVRNSITRNVSIGKVQDGIAILLSEDFNVMEIPLSMLPQDVRKGNILKFTIERNVVEEESRKDGIVRTQKELLGDNQLFDEYNKKLEHFKNKKMEVLQANNKKNLDLQKIIDDVHVNLQDASFLDRSGFIDDDRVIVRPKNIIEAKLEKQDSLSSKTIGTRK